MAGVSTSNSSSEGTGSGQTNHNLSEWRSGRYVDIYATNVLTPVEVKIFVRYRTELSGRVLDLGCGAGRVLSYLVMLGADAYGVDIAPKMVERSKRTVPEATVVLGDISALDKSVEGKFDVVIAPDNLIDIFDDAQRRKVLAHIREYIVDGGLLIFSTHDLGWADNNQGPRTWERKLTPLLLAQKLVEVAPAAVVRSIFRRRREAANKKRLAPLQQRNADHAILNDFPHDYSLLHYYIHRDDQERQLQSLGYEMVECLDERGREVGPGGHGSCDSLTYVARPVQGSGGA
ncbi:MAG TPA: class I SAM-dependent methyltransferase [Solirubrobacteraceae bacterium]|nr:class I SAM-dependent methyltransferase [Solirubrobacteraceae bacterium]